MLLRERKMRMPARVIDGSDVAKRLLDQTRQRAAAVAGSLGRRPSLATVLVGDDPASHTYVRMKASKDVDGVTAASFMAMASGNRRGFSSCTPGGIMALLDTYEVPLAGQQAVIVGRSAILGKPAALLLLARNATVTICHSHTANLEHVVATADIVVAARR
jgi:methylenetetrahydrofolate dehydrogenase (NADP+)/methenyltetrahydrofolate cyclohydrolase